MPIGVRAAKRGLPPIPAFGIGWLYPVCPRRANLAIPRPFFIPPGCGLLSRKCRSVCAPQSGDCHQFPPLELAGCTRFAHAELTSPYPAPFSSRRVRCFLITRLTPSSRRSLPETGCLSQGLPYGKRFAWPCPPEPLSTGPRSSLPGGPSRALLWIFMILATRSAHLKLLAAAATIGAIAAGAFSFTIPRRYVSTAVDRKSTRLNSSH